MADKIKFGTDGVRGPADTFPINGRGMAQIANAACALLKSGDTVLIGRDTRRSGTTLEKNLAEAFAAAGINVFLAGVLPTAAVALAVKETGAALGIMITASHNPASDNGIKIFGPDGAKLDDPAQNQIQARLDNPQKTDVHNGAAGTITATDAAAALYQQAFLDLAPNQPLTGLDLVVDCANGAASRLAPKILRALGADVTELFTAPDGQNINADCGSTAPRHVCAAVRKYGADAGLAFDGDADRLLLVDDLGQPVDGDFILAITARAWQAQNRLKGKEIAATLMSNMGLEEYLHSLGLELARTKIGDRHVSAHLAQSGGNLGGEQSGHILLPDLMPSGDGLLAAITPLIDLCQSGKPAHQCWRPYTPVPQNLHNIRYAPGSAPLQNPAIKAAIKTAVQKLKTKGRLLVRASGTEPLIRIMVEAKDEALGAAVMDELRAAFAKS